MAKRGSNGNGNVSAANVGFEVKLWLAALRIDMDGALVDSNGQERHRMKNAFGVETISNANG